MLSKAAQRRCKNGMRDVTIATQIIGAELTVNLSGEVKQGVAPA